MVNDVRAELERLGVLPSQDECRVADWTVRDIGPSPALVRGYQDLLQQIDRAYMLAVDDRDDLGRRFRAESVKGAKARTLLAWLDANYEFDDAVVEAIGHLLTPVGEVTA